MSYSNKISDGKVAILMATYNAGTFLQEQLLSFSDQTYPFWKLYVSDDGSSDDTVHKVSEFINAATGERSSIKDGPKIGFAANFMSLVCDSNIRADYYAYSDQDDVWYEDKLSKAINRLKEIESSIPALYCSRTSLIDEENNHIGSSPAFQKKPGFCNAMVQSIAGGNTMVFNHAAKKILEQAGEAKIVSHDWWTYIAITACDGIIIYDLEPSVKYRQHHNNLVGTNNGIKQKLKRIFSLFQGNYSLWIWQNIKALEPLNNLMPEENKAIIKKVCKIKRGNLIERLFCLIGFPLYRQTFFGNIALVVATIFRKL